MVIDDSRENPLHLLINNKQNVQDNNKDNDDDEEDDDNNNDNSDLVVNKTVPVNGQSDSNHLNCGSGGTNLKPRVSFNRDVHVKRIDSRKSPDTVPALSAIDSNTELTKGNNTRLLYTLPVRRQKLGHLSRRQLAEEAAKVLKQADSVHCVTNQTGALPEKFYSLPSRKKTRLYLNDSPNSSSERKAYKTRRRRSEELGVTTSDQSAQLPPKKPPRTFAFTTNTENNTQQVIKPPKRTRKLFRNLFKRKRKVVRSKSDVSNTKKPVTLNRTRSDSSDHNKLKLNFVSDEKKAQLSPIIEVSPNVDTIPKNDYFTTNCEQVEQSKNHKIVQAPIKKTENTPLASSTPIKTPSFVVIDVDRAEDISLRKHPWRQSFEDHLKSLTKRKTKQDNSKSDESQIEILKNKFEEEIRKQESDMIHSSQKPVDRLPLTRGQTVDHMVKRLSDERFSPPPKTSSILITPTIGMQHNNNKPFSYTKPTSISPNSDEYTIPVRHSSLSPDYYRSSTSPERNLSPSYYNTRLSNRPLSPPGDRKIIYAQVVCGPETKNHKETIHRTYEQKKIQIQNSDSDEGLGYEEFGKLNSTRNSFNDDLPITPKYQTFTRKEFNQSNYHDTEMLRGKADGMDTSKRRESFTEQLFNDKPIRSDLSSRRELLESRINSRNKLLSTSYSPKQYISEVKSKYYHRHGSESPVGFSEKQTSESYLNRSGDLIKNEVFEKEYFGDEVRNSSSKLLKDFHQSNPELIVQKRYEDVLEQSRHNRLEQNIPNSYHDSLKRNKHRSVEEEIITDERIKQYTPQPIQNESEDEGFQSSLLIAVEKQQNEETKTKYTSEYRTERRDYEIVERRKERRSELDDSDLDSHRRTTERIRSKKHSTIPEYVPRERSIDDGSHYDPRIDKDLEKPVKKVESKPPKSEKKLSSLDKVKNLFSSKKSKEKRLAKTDNQLMVDEDEMRARYSEYKGSQEDLDSKQEVDYSKRKKLATPRSSRSPTPERKVTTTTTKTNTLRSSKPNQTTPQSAHNTSWFKSLDRITRKNKKSNDSVVKMSETEVSDVEQPVKPQKNLRFFGDTDAESNNDSVRHKSTTNRSRSTLNKSHHRSLNNIDERDFHSDIDRRTSSKIVNGKPPVSPYEPRHHSDVNHTRRRGGGDSTLKRLNRHDSLAESSTEGDSSQQSQRSVVYLHAATVGDIPGPGDLARRAASREELSSLASSSRISQPQVKTLSRSFSVLAPWRPRHYRERYDIDYSQKAGPPRSKSSMSSVKSKIESKNTASAAAGTLNRRSKSKESISTVNRKSNDDIVKSTSTLNRRDLNRSKSKSKESISATLNRHRSKDSDSSLYRKHGDSRAGNKSMSMESLGTNNGRRSRVIPIEISDDERRDKVSRSVSMPKDKAAGWFNKKSTRK